MLRCYLFVIFTSIFFSPCLSRENKLVQLEEKDLSKFREDCLKRHNIYRSVHRSSRMRISNELNDEAQQLAEELARANSDRLSRPYNDNGINVFVSSDTINGETPVDVWYSQSNSYDFNDPTPSKRTDAFTQLVWSRSRKLGVGTVKSRGNQYVVCLYSPPGNVANKYSDNVRNPVDLVTGDDRVGIIRLEENEITKFRMDCLKRHNIYRSVHRSRRIRLNDQLNEEAQKITEKLALSDSRRTVKLDTVYGNNILITEDTINGETPVDIWYSQQRNYDYNRPMPNNIQQVDKFTQVVWSRSTQLGVGTVKTTNGRQYVVCLYNPPGNVNGRFMDNVRNIIDLNEN